jgi:hypothetical protein
MVWSLVMARVLTLAPQRTVEARKIQVTTIKMILETKICDKESNLFEF